MNRADHVTNGDESASIPIVKWDPDVQWQVPCAVCGELTWVTWGSEEVIGPYHSGCFGYPMRGCSQSHRGDCRTTS